MGVRGKRSFPRLAEERGSRSLSTSFSGYRRSGAKRLPEQGRRPCDCPRPQLAKEQAGFSRLVGSQARPIHTAQPGLEGPVAPMHTCWAQRAPVPGRLASQGHERRKSTQRQRPMGLLWPRGRPVDFQESTKSRPLQRPATNPTRPQLAGDSMHT